MENKDNASGKETVSVYLPNSRVSELLFWIPAALLLFLNLGIGGLKGSEGRWADVVRMMFLTGDFLHPMINFEPYFDKPLFSYWAIAAGTALSGGEVTELLIRIPSAVAGLISLWATRLIASRFAGKETGFFAGWILLTVYSFAFWGRLGEADMLNLAFGTLAVSWYVLNRDKTDFGPYLLFGLLCAVGGQTKGLSAIAVPVLAVLADLTLRRSWKKHLNWKIFAAGILSLGVYLTPFLLAALKKDYTDNGLTLVFQENIQRFFNSLDHKQPWYAYFIHLPQLFLPWTPFLILAVIAGVKQWKTSGPDDRWILVSCGLIFLVFSLSDSKRVYYILPILPYCAILTARFMLSEGNGMFEKIRNVLLQCYAWLVPLVAAALLATAGFFSFRNGKIQKYAPPPELVKLVLLTMLLTALILLVIWLFFRRRIPVQSFPGGGTGRNFMLSAFSCAVLLIGFFCILMPRISESMRTEKKFFTGLRKQFSSSGIPGNRIFFFHHNYTNASFYLKHPKKIEVLDHEDTAKSENLGRELQNRIENRQGQPLVVIGQLRYFRKIASPSLRQAVEEKLILTEESGSWENRKKNGKKYAVLLLK